MDAPVGHDPESVRVEKQRLFRAMRPIDPGCVVRGQFHGYRDEKGVAADSQVETFAALCLHIDTWRWAGVPFYIRAGKHLPVTVTEEIGRAPGRERVCKSVYILVVAVTLKKTKTTYAHMPNNK